MASVRERAPRLMPATTGLPGVARLHWPAVLTVVAVSAIAFADAMSIRPLDADNLVGLSAREEGSPFSFFTESFVTYAPGYRPLPYLSIWIQHEAHGLTMKPYFLANLAILIAAGIALYALVYRLSGSRLAAVLPALLLILDQRGDMAVFWIPERQTSMALLFGLLALLLAYSPPERSRRGAWLAGIFLLLLASALSKEYGLAFAAAVAVCAVFGPARRELRPVLGTVFLLLVGYGLMRGVLAEGPETTYCEDMGYFTENREVCWDDLTLGARLGQHAYNIGAALVAIPLPALVSTDGALQVLRPEGILHALQNYVVPACALLLAGVGIFVDRRRALALLTLVLATALLSFFLVRSRNQVVGVAGLYAMAGLGVAWVRERLRGRRTVLALAGAGLGLLIAVGLVAGQAKGRANDSESFFAESASRDPCSALEDFPKDVSSSLAAELRAKYKFPDPPCP